MLNDEQINQYHEQGFLVLDQVFELDELEKVKAQAAKIVNDWHDEDRSHTFSTKDNDRSGNDFFLDSAETMSCFFEEEAFDEKGEFVQDRSLCINKIGHALHELDPVFNRFSHQKVLGDIAKDIGLAAPQIRQSMYIYKQPKIGGEVNWHQDATFFFTTPQSVVTYWFAMEDATLENGCLWVEPKGHNGPLRERFNREGSNTNMLPLDDTPWPIDTGVPVEVKAGSLVVFQGKLPHYSAPNRSSKSRQAYTLHVTDGTTEYANENWLHAKTLPLKGFAS
ncbi:MAG: phytanoyl-CoA dioxygenase family protein [Marinomonas sp.]|jgi:phytanoyl-CoA hydroxylase|uniref:phytanoyl-CoA dioxygenase family protein n=1 Tax=unclassified Marinomonas TaxID=196814 RepID=UPI0005F9E8E5|nr:MULTISPECIES: phytanoyl-CoA dioxygenase family protein [unclassified Marinomonas]KJZ10374.1 phytanoyl-CoA dioxygenase [Marinomonas sp. S3726]KZM38501.1 phytanoyl-CoA dioxygenase [Marinomonas sp. SBI22]KZM39016.1 phytanoyl-CoA dioxygenase [Marinomonas sp. SBI8L]